MDDVYYRFIHAGKREIEGIPVADPAILIPLKARAWLDLTERQNAGQHVDDRDIRKHRNDVFRLYQIMAMETVAPLPESILRDLLQFLAAMELENNDNMKALGLRNTSLQTVVDAIRRVYGGDH
jgi:hypothetical protein